MEHTGGCQCGAVRYHLKGEPLHAALCHCTDCRKSSGAPVMHWAAFPSDAFTLTQGALKTYQSSENAVRQFCGTCGTGIAYRNEEVLPGMIDVQGATLDDPNALAPTAHIQTAERLAFMEPNANLPEFERYPAGA